MSLLRNEEWKPPRTVVSAIVAVSENGVIGNTKTNEIPWKKEPFINDPKYVFLQKQDMAYFIQQTGHNPVAVARKTLDSFGKYGPLNNRFHYVLSSDKNLKGPGIQVVNSLDDMRIELAKYQKITLIGGSAIYDNLLQHARYVHVTRVPGEFEGDVTFPNLEERGFKRWYSIPFINPKNTNHQFTIDVYRQPPKNVVPLIERI